MIVAYEIGDPEQRRSLRRLLPGYSHARGHLFQYMDAAAYFLPWGDRDLSEKDTRELVSWSRQRALWAAYAAKQLVGDKYKLEQIETYLSGDYDYDPYIFARMVEELRWKIGGELPYGLLRVKPGKTK
jgi:hypothetical protein